MEWISIEDHRPEITTWVLTLCSKGSNWLAFRANGGWYINTNYGQIYVSNDDPAKQIEIVYWTTIPEIPKKLSTELYMKTHGGKRKGAGRPKLKKKDKKEPTKVVRVPISKLETVLKVIGKV